MALMTLICDDGHLCAWPCGELPISRQQAQCALEDANSYFTSAEMGPLYIKGIVPACDKEDSAWDGVVVPLSPLERLALAGMTTGKE